MDDLLERFCYNAVKYMKLYFPFTISPFGAILWCIILSYALRIFAYALMFVLGENPSNKNPRENETKKGSVAARATAAHYNGLESTIGFAAAVFAATIADFPRNKLEDLCTLYIMIRLMFSFFYVFFSGLNEGLSYVRTALFVMGQIVTYYLFLQAARLKYGYVFLSRL